jgi:hypothetical protein
LDRRSRRRHHLSAAPVGVWRHRQPVAKNAAGLRTEYDATRLFGLPLTAQVDAVQRNPHGFPIQVQLNAVRDALHIDQGKVHGIAGLVGALPVIDLRKEIPGWREPGTTIVTLLFFKPGTATPAQTAGGREYARRFVSAPGATWPESPASSPRNEQGNSIVRYLPWVELATVAAIAIIVGWHFRSFGSTTRQPGLLRGGLFPGDPGGRVGGQRRRRDRAAGPGAILVVLLLGITTVIVWPQACRGCGQRG